MKRTRAGGLRQGHVQQGRRHGGRGPGRAAVRAGGEDGPGRHPERDGGADGAAVQAELPGRREPHCVEERPAGAGHHPQAQECREWRGPAAAAVG